ncbi:SNARE-interacting protein KEULE [Dendrobium catenatum]|uniref:SNARE-interacting protein KEULE n=1 Tax=Dendrobium catenatum TaxID=906689 RepID=A0A2I0WD91_9ASPA|nr:SNARE-interacting protein KEULE [Dendrobium catenatum]
MENGGRSSLDDRNTNSLVSTMRPTLLDSKGSFTFNRSFSSFFNSPLVIRVGGLISKKKPLMVSGKGKEVLDAMTTGFNFVIPTDSPEMAENSNFQAPHMMEAVMEKFEKEQVTVLTPSKADNSSGLSAYNDKLRDGFSNSISPSSTISLKFNKTDLFKGKKSTSLELFGYKPKLFKELQGLGLVKDQSRRRIADHKVLIMDKLTTKIMSCACKMADITEEGVSCRENINGVNLPYKTKKNILKSTYLSGAELPYSRTSKAWLSQSACAAKRREETRHSFSSPRSLSLSRLSSPELSLSRSFSSQLDQKPTFRSEARVGSSPKVKATFSLSRGFSGASIAVRLRCFDDFPFQLIGSYDTLIGTRTGDSPAVIVTFSLSLASPAPSSLFDFAHSAAFPSCWSGSYYILIGSSNRELACLKVTFYFSRSSDSSLAVRLCSIYDFPFLRDRKLDILIGSKSVSLLAVTSSLAYASTAKSR